MASTYGKIFGVVLVVVAIIVVIVGATQGWFSSSSPPSPPSPSSTSLDSSPSPSPTPSSSKPTPTPSTCWRVVCGDSGNFSVLQEDVSEDKSCGPGSYRSNQNLKIYKKGSGCPLLEATTPCWRATKCEFPAVGPALISQAVKGDMNLYGHCMGNESRLEKVGNQCPDRLKESCWNARECGMHTECDHSSGGNVCKTWEAITDAIVVQPDANGQCPSGSSREYKMNNTCPPHLRAENLASKQSDNLSTCACGESTSCICTFCVPKTALNDEPQNDTVYTSFRNSFKTPLSSYTVRELHWPENMSSRPKCNADERGTLHKPGKCIDCLVPGWLTSNYICDEKMTQAQLIEYCKKDLKGTTQGKAVFVPEQ